jgi:hypothetical protein
MPISISSAVAGDAFVSKLGSDAKKFQHLDGRMQMVAGRSLIRF